MQDRFTLRFQDGERQGDTVPITSPRFTLGRLPGNTLQLQDASVSGRHAEFIFDEQGLLLKDLKSTNGTRLGGQKVEKVRPAHGDLLSFGSINAVFEDGAIESIAVSASDSGAGAGVESVSAELLARSGKGSKLGLALGLALLVIGGAAAAFLLGEGGPTRAGKFSAVVALAGNKLAGGSFEGEGVPANWTSDDSAPALFSQRSGARATGREGMRAALAGSEWARLESDPVTVSRGRVLELQAMLRARGDGSGRVGIEFMGAEREDGPGPSHFAFGPWISNVTAHQAISLSAAVPVDATRARVVVEARAAEGGEDLSSTVDVDDIGLLEGAANAGPAGQLADYSLWLRGEPETTIQLSKLNKSLLAELRGAGGDGRRDFPFKLSVLEGGFELKAEGAQELSLRVEAASLAGGLATLGSGGLIERGADFEGTDVTSLLMGNGHDLVALVFQRPVQLQSSARGAGARLRVRHAGQAFRLQVDFRSERARAGDLAFVARKAESNGQLGECLANWNEMLKSVPYDNGLVQEARSTRTRLEQAGLIELAAVESTFEEAQFFRLLDLFRQCRERAIAIGQKYAGSAVETQATQLVKSLDEALAGLEQDLSRDEVRRLNSILNVLNMTDSPGLASAVRSYLNEEFGEEN